MNDDADLAGLVLEGVVVTAAVAKRLHRQALRDAAEIARLRQALAFAKSVILSGEPWTAECARIIGGALDRTVEA